MQIFSSLLKLCIAKNCDKEMVLANLPHVFAVNDWASRAFTGTLNNECAVLANKWVLDRRYNALENCALNVIHFSL